MQWSKSSLSSMIIDADPERSARLARELKSCGFRVITNGDYTAGEQLWRQHCPAVVIVGLDGKTAADTRAATSLVRMRRDLGDKAHVIVLSPVASKESKLACLEAGCDEFYAEPLDVEELAIRIRIFTRRRQNEEASTRQLGPTRIHYESRNIEINGLRISLTEKEFTIATCLFEAAGGTVKRSTIEERLFGNDRVIGSNALDVHVHNLRKKLGPFSILTSRGNGYCVSARLIAQ